MARYSSTNQLTPAGTVLAVGSVFSNPIRTESMRDARVLIKPTALGAGATLDVDVMISDNGTDYYKVASFNQITAAANAVLPLEEHQISSYLKLKYTAAVDTFTIGAKLEGKFGV